VPNGLSLPARAATRELICSPRSCRSREDSYSAAVIRLPQLEYVHESSPLTYTQCEIPTAPRTVGPRSPRMASHVPLQLSRSTRCDRRSVAATGAACVRLVRSGFASVSLIAATPATAQSVPTIDTEDASLGSSSARTGSIHPAFGVDIRNGDFARGNYDDDAAGLDRLPVHVQVGVAADLHRNAAGQADTWVVVRSSNGIHSASSGERMSPRGWYESNNLVGLVAAIVLGFLVAASISGAYSSREQEIWYRFGFAGLFIAGVVLPAAALFVLRRSRMVIRLLNAWMVAALLGSLYFGAISSGGI
jgi:hypothetical protein